MFQTICSSRYERRAGVPPSKFGLFGSTKSQRPAVCARNAPGGEKRGGGGGASHFGQDKLLQVDVLGQCHLGCVNGKDAPLGLDVGQGELNLTIDSSRPDERWVQRVNAIGCHDDLHHSRMKSSEQPKEFRGHNRTFRSFATGPNPTTSERRCCCCKLIWGSGTH